MTRNEEVLGQASTAIASTLGCKVRVFRSEQSLVLSFSDYQEVNVVVSVLDAETPTFRITYPCLQSHHRSLAEAEEVDVEGALLQGVVAVVRGVAEHGVLLPEFPHPRVQKELRRRRRR